jgi:ribulose-phosphate 3-epimerase
VKLDPLAGPLWLDVSLWSADLANLERDIRRLEPFADSFHLDAADGHSVRNLLFFPDLVARIRQITSKPLHVHLFATRPMDLAPLFVDAGADWLTVPLETGKRVWQVLEWAQGRGCRAGVSLELETPVELVRGLRQRVQHVVLMGTPSGVKGCGLDERACDRMAEASAYLEGTKVLLLADGGIRQETVPLLRASGAQGIVPGSLLCSAEDPAAVHEWLKSL